MWTAMCALAIAANGSSGTGNVIFIHPDGTGLNSWFALRYLERGPDGQTEWDRLSKLALYRGHPTNSLTPSSNAGGTMHAYGTRVSSSSFGTDGGAPVPSAAGNGLTILQEALRTGLNGGIVSSASITDAGTGTFLARAPSRRDHEVIAARMIEAGPTLIMGGGEQFFLPKGERGRHGEGIREDGRNLITEATRAGYTVVYTRDELASLSPKTPKVLGLFAADDTFNDDTEEELAKAGKPLYQPQAPAFDQMVEFGLKLLGDKKKRFLFVAEEEGTDNFAGDNNAVGTLEALSRADRAIGHARRFVNSRKDTLMMVAADSMCAAMTVVDAEQTEPPYPARDEENGAPLDGQSGTATAPFVSGPDRAGKRFPFFISWGASGDAAGNTVVRAHGWGSDWLPNDVHATDLYALMNKALFGRQVPMGTWKR